MKLRLLIPFVVVAGAFAVAAGCGEKGVTPQGCPDLPLYDIKDPNAVNDPAIRAQIAEVEKAGCATPMGSATSGPRDGGSTTPIEAGNSNGGQSGNGKSNAGGAGN